MASSVRQTFMVERYAVDLSVDQVLFAGEHAEEAAPLLAPGGRARYLGSVLLPTDEMALCFFEGTSESVVRAAVGQAALAFERITPAVRVGRRSTGQALAPAWLHGDENGTSGVEFETLDESQEATAAASRMAGD